MSFIKQAKDYAVKILWHGKTVPFELFELSQYFRCNGPINFKNNKEGDEIIAVSTNFRHGTIITSAKTDKELDERVKDAILTAFEVPSSYKKEACIQKQEKKDNVYAFA
jgi:ABC-type phosphate/phosphonate transport system substrate-binding protein